VISSSDEQVVIALRIAAARIAVPPESRWVRERGSVRDVWVFATLAVAVVALIAVIGALRGEPRLVPGSASHTVPPPDTRAASRPGPFTFDVSDDAPWLTARAKAAPDFVVLRPTWLPRRSASASACEIDLQRPGEDTSSEEYHVWYVDSRMFAGGPRCSLMFGGHRDTGWGGDLPNYSPAPLATFVARGNVVYVRQSGPSDPVYLGWIEHGAFYEVIAEGFELSDLIRAVNSLEPVR
jgi:hypothetical protein